MPSRRANAEPNDGVCGNRGARWPIGHHRPRARRDCRRRRHRAVSHAGRGSPTPTFGVDERLRHGRFGFRTFELCVPARLLRLDGRRADSEEQMNTALDCVEARAEFDGDCCVGPPAHHPYEGCFYIGSLRRRMASHRVARGSWCVVDDRPYEFLRRRALRRPAGPCVAEGSTSLISICA